MSDDGASEQDEHFEMQAVRKITRIRPEDMPTVYANDVAMQISIWDFTLDFGSVVNQSDGIVTIRSDARVIMSPQHAKVFSDVLAKHVRNYEEQFGRIPTPPERGQEAVDSLTDEPES